MQISYQPQPLYLPVDGYNFIVKTIKSLDGQNYYYSGHCRYFKTEAEAKAYKEEQEDRQQ